jgi:hypothetical protein
LSIQVEGVLSRGSSNSDTHDLPLFCTAFFYNAGTDLVNNRSQISGGCYRAEIHDAAGLIASKIPAMRFT